MISIDEKIAYLEETKAEIARAIEDKGVNVSSSDTFRSYANKIRSIQGGYELDRLDVSQNGTYTAELNRGFSPVVVNVQPNLGSKSITENGTYNASNDDKQGYSSVTVNVEPDLTTKSITENGTYAASSDNKQGYSSVTVNVEPDLTTKSITENGTYAASSDNKQGYSSVTVNVQPTLGTKNITVSGTYNASSDLLQGYSSVAVDIPVPRGGSTLTGIASENLLVGDTVSVLESSWSDISSNVSVGETSASLISSDNTKIWFVSNGYLSYYDTTTNPWTKTDVRAAYKLYLVSSTSMSNVGIYTTHNDKYVHVFNLSTGDIVQECVLTKNFSSMFSQTIPLFVFDGFICGNLYTNENSQNSMGFVRLNLSDRSTITYMGGNSSSLDRSFYWRSPTEIYYLYSDTSGTKYLYYYVISGDQAIRRNTVNVSYGDFDTGESLYAFGNENRLYFIYGEINKLFYIDNYYDSTRGITKQIASYNCTEITLPSGFRIVSPDKWRFNSAANKLLCVSSGGIMYILDLQTNIFEAVGHSLTPLCASNTYAVSGDTSIYKKTNTTSNIFHKANNRLKESTYLGYSLSDISKGNSGLVKVIFNP